MTIESITISHGGYDNYEYFTLEPGDKCGIQHRWDMVPRIATVSRINKHGVVVGGSTFNCRGQERGEGYHGAELMTAEEAQKRIDRVEKAQKIGGLKQDIEMALEKIDDLDHLTKIATAVGCRIE
jgi:hypothetical protein